MKYTDNLNLKKPEQTEFYNVDDFNENADILDEEIQDIKNTFVKSVNGINAGDDGNVDLGIMPIAKGGTGQTTASGVRNALGLGNTTGALPIANGGTGANSASDACANIGALPTSGGEMTGTIAFNNGNMSNSKIFDNSGESADFKGLYISAFDKNEVQGARLVLRHALSRQESGCFLLQANKDNNSKSLIGTPAGELTWNGKSIEVVEAIGTNYIKYKNGTLIIFDTITIASGSLSATYTLPVPFLSNNNLAISTMFLGDKPQSGICNVTGRSTTNITVNCISYNGYYDYNRAVSLIMIGRWK